MDRIIYILRNKEENCDDATNNQKKKTITGPQKGKLDRTRFGCLKAGINSMRMSIRRNLNYIRAWVILLNNSSVGKACPISAGLVHDLRDLHGCDLVRSFHHVRVKPSGDVPSDVTARLSVPVTQLSVGVLGGTHQWKGHTPAGNGTVSIEKRNKGRKHTIVSLILLFGS
jgi:hypothetical protein